MRIYTDGSCNKAKRGGWAWCEEPDGEIYASGCEGVTTSQRMELQAALEALKSHPGQEVTIVTDSMYLVNGFTKGWVQNWKRNGWKTSNKEPVANQDLWSQLDAEYQSRPVQFLWVKGHNGDPLNERADYLAGKARAHPSATPPNTFDDACTFMYRWYVAVRDGLPIPEGLHEEVGVFLNKVHHAGKAYNG